MGFGSLTPRQLEICRFVDRFGRDHGMPPSMQEIADEFGFAGPSGVRDHLKALERKGAIIREPGKARSLKVAPGVLGGRDRGGIPVLGRIAAGVSIEAVENYDRALPIPGMLFAGQTLFALLVRGESMINEGIRDGDMAIINRQDEVNDGEIAAVILDDEATLKKVLRQRNRLILRAANADYPDIVVSSSDRRTVRIAGRYVGLFRSLQLPQSMSA